MSVEAGTCCWSDRYLWALLYYGVQLPVIFAAYSYQGRATVSKVSKAATTYVDRERGKLFVCTVILCQQAAPY